MKNNTKNKEYYWERFRNYFWILFIIKIIFRFIAFTSADANLELQYLLVGAQLIPTILMAFNMAYHAYKLSGKKIYLLTGLLGFLWIGVFGIFIGYWVVKTAKK